MPIDFDSEGYFQDCYGIIYDEDIKPTEVKLKISPGQTNYLRALPLHHSQQKTETSKDYSIFCYSIKPTFDFRQEILSMGEDAEVISRAGFREEFKNIYDKMIVKYD